ncbi:MAG: TetR family transcriptional regulator C-terminal domain-containing protein [Sediminicola sp.]
MATTTKKVGITRESIITAFMGYVAEHGQVPKSIYGFCKNNKIKEQDFYGFFGSVEGIKKAIWEDFFTNAHSLIIKNGDYDTMSSKDKMLTFLFTFFEVLTLNRTYVLISLKESHGIFKTLDQLKGLRVQVRSFAKDLIMDGNALKKSKLGQHPVGLFSEGAWVQLLFLLRFWVKDGSPAFEKTDLAIEKSVNTIFDLFDHTPLDNIIDFGKFMYRETTR